MKNMKNFVSVTLIVTALFLTSVSFAEHRGKEGCGGASCPLAGKQEYQCPVTAKFMMKADFIMKNQEKLNLTEDQIATIKKLKLDVQKAYIRQMADMQVWMLDLDAKTSEPKMDVEAINGMIDEGSASMAKSGKSMVASYAELKSTLTEEQMTKLKEIWRDSHKS